MFRRSIIQFRYNITQCYRKSLVLHGRAGRAELWCFFGLHALILTGYMAFFSQTGQTELSVTNVPPYGLYSITEHTLVASNPASSSTPLSRCIYAWFILLSVPALVSVQVRRLHDINRSGKYLIPGLLVPPFILVLIAAYCWRGEQYPNIFGDQPHYAEEI